MQPDCCWLDKMRLCNVVWAPSAKRDAYQLVYMACDMKCELV